MLPLSRLKRTAQEALALIRGLPEVREAEVFVSANGSLFARLNYTSHIPSNGVEEPKSLESFGIGVRAVFETPEGVKIGFGSEPGDLSPEGVRRALEKARRNAVHDPDFVSLPRPAGETPRLRRYHDPTLMRLTDEGLVALGWSAVEGALEAFSSAEDLLAWAGSPEGVRRLGLILGGDVTVLQERMALASTHFPSVLTDESTVLLCFLTAMVEERSAKGSGWWVGPHSPGSLAPAGQEAARNAVRGMDGVRVPSGEYRVVFGPQAVMDLLENLVVPSLSLETVYAGASCFQGKLRKVVASPLLSLYDDGARPDLAASKAITCEGLPTGRTDLLREGVLVGFLSNFYRFQQFLRDPRGKEKLGADPAEHKDALAPRNGFRFARGGGRHFDTPPGIFGTNIILEGKDPLPREDLLRRVGEGLYIGRIWYTYPINGLARGDFTCTVVGDSYLIKDGRLDKPLKPNTLRLNDNIHNILTGVIGVGRETRGTIVWASDSIVYTPEIAVARVHAEEIARYMETLYPSP